MVHDLNDFFVIYAYTHDSLTQVAVFGLLFKLFVKIVNSQHFFMYFLRFVYIGLNLVDLQFLGRIILPEFN